MEQLEIKHLAPYLPFKLKIKSIIDGSIVELFSLAEHQYTVRGNINLNNGTTTKEFMFIDFVNYINLASPKNFKPILRDLSDLTKEIEHNGERFYPFRKLLTERDCDAEYDFIAALEDDYASMDEKIRFAPYSIFSKLLEWHFNVFNLPEHLFIDINTLNK